jgi:2'-5' RNA ligase
MTVVRTFVAVLLADELRKRISEAQEQVKKLAPDVKWVAPDNFHVTLKFLGDVREDALGGVFSAVEEAAKAFAPFELSMSGLGAFPNARNARVVWAGIEDGRDELAALASAVDVGLVKLGYPKEERDFKSHITIGRVKTSRRLDDLARGIDEIDAGEIGRQTVSSVAVMQSDLRPEGPIYTALRVVEFAS